MHMIFYLNIHYTAVSHWWFLTLDNIINKPCVRMLLHHTNDIYTCLVLRVVCDHDNQFVYFIVSLY